MPDYTLTFARSARQELERLDAEVVRRIWARIEALSANPRPRGCTKLMGTKDLWRIRVGHYRVIYMLSEADRTVDVIAVRHRRDAYR